jgi:uncharacterized protein (TIGR00255 family)
MLKSMTAFARKDQLAQKTKYPAEISWEIRSVNHRYIDVSLSLSSNLNAFENAFNKQIKNKLGRGKVDAKLILNVYHPEKDQGIPLNKDKVKALLSARHMLESISKKPVTLSGMDILSWPGVLEKVQESGEDYLEEISELLDMTLDELIKTRQNEGQRLEKMIVERCDQINQLVNDVKERRVKVVAAMREKVLQKLADIDITADSNRLEQEIVFQTQRLDVDEELDRLDAHIEEIRDVLKRDEPVGRRLDFLMQELHREANTLASKSNDAETTRAAVDLKVLIEQMREQIMNIE